MAKGSKQPAATGSARLPEALRLCVGSGLVIAGMAAAAALTSSPFVFPSLGPTALMIVAQPRHPSSRPATIATGHVIGLAMGYLGLLIAGLEDAPSALPSAVDGARVAAVVLSLGLTGALMVAVRRFHAPAGATTLIISLGLITAPRDLLIVLVSVLALAVIAAGLDAFASE